MEELLNAVSGMLQKGDIYTCWSGTVYDSQNRFIRIDKLCLNILRCEYGNRGLMEDFMQVLPCYDINATTKEPCIRYDMRECCRITSGKRRGRVVPATKVKDEERWTVAGFRKELWIDRKHGFLPTRTKDTKLIPLLQGFQPQDLAVDIAEHMPSLYITVPSRDSKLFVRKSGRVLQYIRRLPVYNNSMSLEDNLPVVRNYMAVDAGNGRVGYPFDIFFGRGVVAADLFSEGRCVIGTWYKCTNLATSTGSMEIG
jgi:hypothetical protein